MHFLNAFDECQALIFVLARKVQRAFRNVIRVSGRKSAERVLVTAMRVGIKEIKNIKRISQWKIRILEKKKYHFCIG
jgi:hypothetical protein